MKKILIFGSHGLVGKSLQRKFKNKYKQENLFFSNRNDTNLFSFKETKKTIDAFEPDVLINAAAKVGGIYANNSQRTEFLIENLKINLNILESCIEHKDTLIINLGSSCIYPLNASNPIKESSIMTGALEPTNSPYAMAKLTSIELANSLNIQFGHTVVNLMPTNLYGPEDNFSDMDSHVIPGLINRMHKATIDGEEVFKIWGTGEPKREFMHVDDLASAIDYIIENKVVEPLINIGSNEEVTIKELALLLKEIIGFSGDIEFDKNMPDGNPRKLLDSTMIRNFGWVPQIDLNSGLEQTYKWYLDNKD
jgi:GDP-L-fucose synthase